MKFEALIWLASGYFSKQVALCEMDKNRLFQTNLHVFWMFQAKWEKWQRICWSYVNQQRCFLESVCLSRNGDQNDGIWNGLSGSLAGGA